MGNFKVADWAKEWLKEERATGRTCIEVKAVNGNHYVYNSTSKYDPETKGCRKVSSYVGKLKLEDGKAVFTPKKNNCQTESDKIPSARQDP